MERQPSIKVPPTPSSSSLSSSSFSHQLPPQEWELLDHFLVSATSVAISVLGSPPLPSAAAPHLQSLAETLLAVANRPNHGPDRHTRAVACECLRELELAFPLLLSDVAGHLWALAQAERTHAAQSYPPPSPPLPETSLLSSPSSILSTAAPLVPFAIPHFLFSDPSPVPSPSPPSDLNLREIRRVVAFLMDRPQSLTPPRRRARLGARVHRGRAAALGPCCGGAPEGAVLWPALLL
ncbi:hypothetical protein ACMD2_22327 [Ananas comosus]|uniref:Uncharacterized protein n=1 Tax=Ananas comosus TaxID=4615 RepID=A0A199W1A3_ANACO|nr:hypothetical protein ACMD2_22327 [Ananas comosus]